MDNFCDSQILYIISFSSNRRHQQHIRKSLTWSDDVIDYKHDGLMRSGSATWIIIKLSSQFNFYYDKSNVLPLVLSSALSTFFCSNLRSATVSSMSRMLGSAGGTTVLAVSSTVCAFCFRTR